MTTSGAGARNRKDRDAESRRSCAPTPARSPINERAARKADVPIAMADERRNRPAGERFGRRSHANTCDVKLSEPE